MLKVITTIALLLTVVSCSSRTEDTGQSMATDLNQLTPEQWQTLSQRTVYFGHQSVGADIIEGIQELVAEKPQIKLRIVSGAPASTPGVLSEFPIGNNGDPESKNAAFVAAVQGVLGPKPVFDVQILLRRRR